MGDRTHLLGIIFLGRFSSNEDAWALSTPHNDWIILHAGRVAHL